MHKTLFKFFFYITLITNIKAHATNKYVSAIIINENKISFEDLKWVIKYIKQNKTKPNKDLGYSLTFEGFIKTIENNGQDNPDLNYFAHINRLVEAYLNKAFSSAHIQKEAIINFLRPYKNFDCEFYMLKIFFDIQNLIALEKEKIELMEIIMLKRHKCINKLIDYLNDKLINKKLPSININLYQHLCFTFQKQKFATHKHLALAYNSIRLLATYLDDDKEMQNYINNFEETNNNKNTCHKSIKIIKEIADKKHPNVIYLVNSKDFLFLKPIEERDKMFMITMISLNKYMLQKFEQAPYIPNYKIMLLISFCIIIYAQKYINI
jgi:hypothetical protein